ncbi:MULTISPECIES: DUF3013 family protein [unclassified Streptococcus]|uniref:DUF3013 family protein n=1 Tax=unclassified Streptococcus TaxID=2608887 RepID=UPI0010719BD4|nr:MULTISPECIES: DUF3013 family protein [unclassified Streptococcus]MBF0787563.1 DUF3013 family protein [Streptococcus sp. 19428wC2_LYSM12]MCQ9211412.1 DUF3013 family protein [Streptococcus sp. B01]MCQ9214725.1 DUF3013 family protein [Streptococcus sp. O1]TFV05512.1 DUF3013 family protein [Streptococcus sp. LYSM12]
MSKYGFLDVLDQKMEQGFPYDFEMEWDKKNHSVEVAFLLEVENKAGIETVDDEGNTTTEDIFFEEVVLFYNPLKSRVKEEDYLVAIPYEPKKGLSSEFIAYFVAFLAETAEKGLDDLMDFLADDEAEEFAIAWDKEAFEAGRVKLAERDFFPYPRY